MIRFWSDRPHGKRNFGDEIGLLLLHHYGLSISRTNDITKTEMLFIGGNLELLPISSQASILGAGFNCAGPEYPNYMWNVELIRGPLSAKRLNWPGNIGDPAVLIPDLLDKNPPKRFQLGIAPHVHGDQKYNRFIPKEATLIDLSRPPLTVLKTIAECDAVATSSVHAWLTAAALGLPVKRFSLGPTPGDNFRWEDVCSGLSIPTPMAGDDFRTYNLKSEQQRVRAIIKSCLEKYRQL